MTGDAARLPAPESGGGVSLRALIDASQRLDELSTARVIGAAAEVVHKAQKAGAALGTLTPEAIVVRASGDVALELPPAGRPEYAAPERLRGSPGDRRSDVFSLGVLLWEALAHEPLFAGASEDAVRAAALGGEVRPPSACNANIPAELDAICKKALARDPADRYQSAKVMAAEIAAVLDDAGYPETNERLARYVAATPAPAPALAPAPSRPAAAPEGSGIGRATVLGIAPVRAADEPAARGPDRKQPAEPVAALRPVEADRKQPAEPASPATAAPEPDRPTATAPAASSAEPAGAGLASVPLVLGPIPGGTVEPSSPSKLGALSVSSHTAILGSLGPEESAQLTGGAWSPPPPAAPSPERTEVEAAQTPSLAASVAGAAAIASSQAGLYPALDTTPGEAAAPAPAEAVAAATGVDTPATGVDTPATGETAGAASVAADAAIGAPGSAADAADPELAHAPNPISVVALRSPARGDISTSGADMLGGWGWGPDGSPAIDEEYEDHGRTSRKRVVLAIGGAAALLLIAIVAIAASGSKPSKEQGAPPSPAAQAAKAWEAPAPQTAGADPAASAAAAKPAEPAPPPAAAEPAAAAPTTTADAPAAAGSAAAPAPIAAAPEPVVAAPPPQPAPIKPELPRIDAPRQPEPRQPEPRQPEPKKVEPRQPAPKQPAIPAVAARKPDRPKADPAQPLDPYAAAAKAPPKIDAGEAYKTGLQQFARGDSNGALATFKASLAANPGFAPTWRGIGLVYEKLGRKAQARTAFQKYLDLAPAAGDAGAIRDRMGRL